MSTHMKGWIFLSGDGNWKDYGGTWGRMSPDGSWYVIKFTNMIDAVGKREVEATGCDVYSAEVIRLDLTDLTDAQIGSALASCGYERDGDRITSGDNVLVQGDAVEACLVEFCVQYGLGAPVGEHTGKAHPDRVRAAARRTAKTLMADPAALAAALAEPVNAIGSTAAEHGRGDILAGLDRGPFTDRKQLIRKIQGMPPGE